MTANLNKEKQEKKTVSKLTKQNIVMRLARGGAWSLLVKLGAAFLSFVMFIAVARGMSPEDFGLFGFGFSVATMMVISGSLGQRKAALRFIPAYIERGDIEAISGFTRRGYVIVLFGCGALCLIFFAISSITPRLTGGTYALSVGLFTIVLALAEYQAHVLRAHGGIVLALAPREVIWRGLVSLIFVIPALGLIPDISAAMAFVIIALILCIIILVQACLHPATRPSALLAEASNTTDRAIWNRAAGLFWGTGVLRAATPNIAMIVIGVVMPIQEAGAFFAAFRLSMLLNLVLIAANMLALPLFSGANERGDMMAVRSICRFVTLATALPAILAFLLFLFAGDITLALYSREFGSAHGALVIMALGYLVMVLCGPTSGLLQMMGQEQAVLNMTVWINAALLILLVPFVYSMGINGAALATGLQLAATGLFGCHVCRRNLGVDPSIFGALSYRGERR